MSAMEIDLPHLSEEVSRHGRRVLYVRWRGARRRMVARPGEDDFLDEYRAHLADLRKANPPAAPERGAKSAATIWPRGTLGWLIERYLADSLAFAQMAETGRKRRRTRLKAMQAEHGGKPAAMNRARIEAGLAKRAAKPGSANNWLKDMQSLYRWACDAGHVAENPTRGVSKLRTRGQGFHTWSVDEIAAFLAQHGPGTMARRALLIMLFTLLRRSDVVRAGRQHISASGQFLFTAGKNCEIVDVHLPAFVRAELGLEERSATMALLRKPDGRAFASGNSFGNWFKERCIEAGLPHCSCHGLRKAASTIAAEQGASDLIIQTMLADRDPTQARTYTAAANRQKLSRKGTDLVAGALQTMINRVAPAGSGQKVRQKQRTSD